MDRTILIFWYVDQNMDRTDNIFWYVESYMDCAIRVSWYVDVAGVARDRGGRGLGGGLGDGGDGSGDDVQTTLPSGQIPRPSRPRTKYPIPHFNQSERFCARKKQQTKRHNEQRAQTHTQIIDGTRAPMDQQPHQCTSIRNT